MVKSSWYFTQIQIRHIIKTIDDIERNIQREKVRIVGNKKGKLIDIKDIDRIIL